MAEESSPLLPFVRRNKERVSGIWSDFKAFVDRGNVLDLAVGIVIGSAFSEVVTSFVSDVFTPFLGLIVSSKLSETFVVLRYGEQRGNYKTRDEARKDGAITWNYGNFMQLLINFFLVSAALFVVVRIIQAMHRKQQDQQEQQEQLEKETEPIRECKFCYSRMDPRATKCPSCTMGDQNGGISP
jgi:large conductance mechanosensitive channel